MGTTSQVVSQLALWSVFAEGNHFRLGRWETGAGDRSTPNQVKYPVRHNSCMGTMFMETRFNINNPSYHSSASSNKWVMTIIILNQNDTCINNINYTWYHGFFNVVLYISLKRLSRMTVEVSFDQENVQFPW